MAQWFTVERVTQFLRIVFALIGLIAGNQAYQGNAVLANREGGVAAASTEDKLPVNANMTISGLSVFLAAYRKPIESALKYLGVPENIASTGIRLGVIADIFNTYHKASVESQPDLRKAARVEWDALFDASFPVAEKPEAAK